MPTINLPLTGVQVGEYLNAGGAGGLDTRFHPETVLEGGDAALVPLTDDSYAKIGYSQPAYSGAPYYGGHQDAVTAVIATPDIDPAWITNLSIQARFLFDPVQDGDAVFPLGALSPQGYGLQLFVYDNNEDSTTEYAGWNHDSSPPTDSGVILDYTFDMRQELRNLGYLDADAIAAIQSAYTNRLCTNVCSLVVTGGVVIPDTANWAADYPNFTTIYDVTFTITWEPPPITGNFVEARRIIP